MTGTQRVIAELMRLYPEVLQEVTGLQPSTTLDGAGVQGRCILATKVGREVLHYFGILAHPVAVNLVAGNRPWLDWFVAQSGNPMPDGAWAVAASKNYSGRTGNGWDGHLLLEIPGDPAQLLDLDFQQFARPTYGMDFPPTLLLPLAPAIRAEDYRALRTVWWADDDSGCVLGIQQTQRTDYRTAPDWQRYSHRQIIGPLIRAIRHTP